MGFYNAYRFFILEAGRFERAVGPFRADEVAVKSSSNVTDRWIIASKNELIQFVRDEMDAYRLYTVAPRVVAFLGNFTNWYVRLDRDRMKGNDGEIEWRAALCTLYDVLLNVSILLAPLTPFITEFLYQNLSRALPDDSLLKAKSIHFVLIPEADKSRDVAIVTAVSRTLNCSRMTLWTCGLKLLVRQVQASSRMYFPQRQITSISCCEDRCGVPACCKDMRLL